MGVAAGKVYLVGAGPGDPGLITVKGAGCLRKAEVILYDRLVDPSLLRYAPAECHLIYVGKSSRNHALSQDEINALLVEHGLAGRTVVRLKGGDPFVFGRGGEELEALQTAGIPFEVVPGVTAAIAAPAYAGIPVTHRGLTSSFAVVTGHEDPTKPDSSIDWPKLATATGTIVFLMGVENLPLIVDRLTSNGRSPATPVALVRWGTWPQQEVVSGTLDDIAQRAADRKFKPPAVIIVGETVRLRERLRWFDNRPLSGKRVLVTRSRDQASQLSERLRELGAEALEAPAIEISAPHDFSPIDSAIDDLGAYRWIVFTSVNGVNGFFRRLSALGKDTRSMGNVRVAAVGPATAERLTEFGVTADYVPPRFLTSEVAAGLIASGVRGYRVLLPRTDIVGEDLAGALAAAGAMVDQVVAYRTAPAPTLEPEVLRRLNDGEVDFVTFTSSSTVRNFLAALGTDAGSLRGVPIATIGPVTSATARAAGLQVTVEAVQHTVPGLVAAILEFVQHNSPGRG